MHTKTDTINSENSGVNNQYKVSLSQQKVETDKNAETTRFVGRYCILPLYS